MRCGYSAATFLAAGATSYHGYDATNTYGGYDGAVAFARQMLPTQFPGRIITITDCDSQKTDKLDVERIDLFHVDGDHSFAGALHDLELALISRPKWIRVDDVAHHAADVGQAVWTFVDKHGLKHILLPVVRGDVLIQTGL